MLGLRRDGGLARSLRLLTLCFYGTGLVLGGAVYTIAGDAAGLAGASSWSAFVLGAVPALLTGLSYAELAATFPDAGAEYVYLRHAFPRARFARVVVGLALLCGGLATAAVVALDFGRYVADLVPLPAVSSAAVLVAAGTLANAGGLRWTTPLVVAFTLAEVLGLVAVGAIGAGSPDFGHALTATPGPGVLAGASLAFLAYLGFEDIANLAEETRSPARNVPAAILVCLAVTTFLYVLVALASVALVDPATLASSDRPLVTAVAAVAPWVARGLGAAVLFGTANTVVVALLAASRMALGMARGRDLPNGMARIHPQRRTPVPAVLAVGGGALLLVPFAGLPGVASLGILGLLVGFVAVNVA
ncbi:MAG: APC family permease, partial [Myxococcota bacterium]